jgi:hypothetical protein
MRTLAAAELLELWDRGQALSSVERALALLEAACEESAEQLAALSIGRRDTLLIALRGRTFGSGFAAIAACPACGERLDLSFDVEDLLIQAGDPPPEITVESEGYRLRLRLPTSADLLALPDGSRPAVRRALFSRCLVSAERDGAPVTAAALPDAVVEEAAEEMASVDSPAGAALAVSCPACGRPWDAPFDIARYFWTELNAWAERMLVDVHLLAATYGWREREILALSPRRRQLYLEMVGA